MVKCIFGLGNIGDGYLNNRHNAGFIVLDNYAKISGFLWQDSVKKLECYYSMIKYDNTTPDFYLVKPSTYMNESGRCVSKFLKFFKIDAKNIMIVHDDVDLPVGKIKLQNGGSSAGHHGIESIISHLGTAEFLRLRVGIGRPSETNFDVADWVLQDFKKEERSFVESIDLNTYLNAN